jgi:hypothetical protein
MFNFGGGNKGRGRGGGAQAITEKQKHNVGFKPFNDFNCQMHTKAEKANSLINHVQFYILIYFCFNRGDDSFPIVNFPFFSSNIVIVPHTVYEVYVSQLSK